jgi:hypothetical protein
VAQTVSVERSEAIDAAKAKRVPSTSKYAGKYSFFNSVSRKIRAKTPYKMVAI